MRKGFEKQVDLLLDALPVVLKDTRFALKGGTAINFFYRNFPRLSVDIDLCWLPLEDRETTFAHIHQALGEIKKMLEKNLGMKVTTSFPLDGKKESRIMAQREDAGIKIEPNYIVRGSLFKTQMKDLATATATSFNKDVSVQCLSLADIYGGKICAALDRQHPRDLFDIKTLFEHEGITEDIKDSFIFHLISHNRPINELLDPRPQDIKKAFTEDFEGMTSNPVHLKDLESARTKLFREIISVLTETDRKFLVGFSSNSPDWSLVRDERIKDFPSVQWKLSNQMKMDEGKRKKQVDALIKKLL